VAERSPEPRTERAVPFPFHGGAELRGLDRVPHSQLYAGRFGRMFRRLPAFRPLDARLQELASQMVEPDAAGLTTSAIPAGYTYFGQFIDHDITFDPGSKLQRENDPDALVNFRTPRFDLDSIYGAGPRFAPYLYDTDGVSFRIGLATDGERDLPRTAPGEGTPLTEGDSAPRLALIADPRNDENTILSQLTLAFLRFHNKVVSELKGGLVGEPLLLEARRVVQWHYQWLVVHDFLERIVGPEVVHDILREETYVLAVGDREERPVLRKGYRKFFNWRCQPFMPVEFSVAAYRFGHAMVRPHYALNVIVPVPADPEIPIFVPKDIVAATDDLRGFRERTRDWTIEWHRFFRFPEDLTNLQFAQKIRPKLAAGLAKLPLDALGADVVFRALAERDLLRAKALGLPDGQMVARAMGLPKSLILQGSVFEFERPPGNTFSRRTPLWYYILQEAHEFHRGERLGPVGGRIVAEVLLGLLEGDPSSYLRIDPNWEPTPGEFGAPEGANPHDYTMADFLRYAEVVV
jgi:hypothetical protein